MANGTYKSKGNFSYKSLEALQEDIDKLDLGLKLSSNFDVFKNKITIGEHTIPNALATHPMEGGDSDSIGSPTDLTTRKYENMAKGGSGLIWIEAVSISEEGRSNDKQLWLKEDNWQEFKKLNDLIKASAKEAFGDDFEPITIIQLNHSGRYCKVNGKPNPIIATHKKPLDDRLGITEDYETVTDEYLDELIEKFIVAARLSKKAGFDGVDVKACHGYLLGELLSAYNREGKYGGSFENRTKIIKDIVQRIKEDQDCQGLLIAARLNVYDALPYPHGFGVSKDGSLDVDLEEPKKLIQMLSEEGVKLISLTMGNPYFIPHINKPYDMGKYTPEEEVIFSCNRLIEKVGTLQKAFPDVHLVGVGYSWFRQLAPYVAAGSLENNMCRIVGFGRESISYPDFAKDILDKGEMVSNKVCISCSKCSEMKAKIGTCGCVIRDADVYMPIYKAMNQ
ncbi:2,4-dienoyl-CoA reductase-like NADH-dependent reductase (Old Yellow Enzyme family) [Natranaerovirga hydrolytica]|uniref:2,4-dienoyl-CoA reductase-like NADH-dependent reductase (Old Yellow Enzyme family) n=1 Tax=Natranaerovirga hydrolytica TaxID=680378 RepID=A0A4V2Q1R4_9FIRM|nr:flavin oxidoreductase/NADH oxidase [Natranaerovirga hydrolytica]TCK98641.1 2,4-dienoyl-CoA reductase-like NADH-dependent reductase (Old Yellow Enzyme family) [Natranaerovirga hydrolytica]